MPITDVVRCSASTKSTGQPCGQPAVKGFTVCRLHGAGNVHKGKVGGRPIKHGRYSSRLPERLASKYREAQSDQRLLELRDEIALVDTRLGELLERLTTGESGQGWRDVQAAFAGLKATVGTGNAALFQSALASLGDAIGRGHRDNQVWDEILSLVDHRRKLVESEAKRLQTMQQMVSSERLMILLAAVVDVIRRHVNEPTTLASISTGIRGLISQSDGRQSDPSD